MTKKNRHVFEVEYLESIHKNAQYAGFICGAVALHEGIVSANHVLVKGMRNNWVNIHFNNLKKMKFIEKLIERIDDKIKKLEQTDE